MEREARLAAVAEAQGGAFTVAQALAVGFTKPAIRHGLHAGRWVRVRRGVLTSAHRAVEPAAGTPAWHFWLALQAQAVLLAAPRGAVISHVTAALLWQLPLLRCSALPVHVTVGESHRLRRQEGRVVHRSDLAPSQIVRVLDVPVTRLARTLVDLARTLPLADAVIALDSAYHESRVDEGDLVEVLAGLSRGPGAARAGAAIDLADARAESPLESLARLLFTGSGLPPFEIQVEIVVDGRFVARVDFLWRRHRLVVEVDGLGKYDDVRRIRRERARDAALLAAGYRVLHLTWAQVVHEPERTVAAVGRLLAA